MKSLGEILGIVASIVVILDFAIIHGAKFLGLGSVAMQSKYYNISVNVLLVLALILSSTSIFLWTRAGGNDSSNVVHFPRTDIEHLKYIHGKHYVKEEVKIDGIHFDACTFENVTLTYDGTDNAAFGNSKFSNIRVKTNSDSVSTTISFLKAMGFIKDGVPVIDKDEKRIIPIPGSEQIR
jgi:hypothetical protein